MSFRPIPAPVITSHSEAAFAPRAGMGTAGGEG
jgi:hypothetical protein